MLNIHLGYACNFRCGYCLQNPKQSRQRLDTERFVDRIVPILRDTGITRIAYWGGEPLLYWKQIEAIHAALRSAGLELDFIKIVTNGSLLSEEHVEILNNWRAFVVVSDHGEEGTPRWNMVAKLERSSVSFLFRHGALEAWPWFEKLEYLENRYGRPFWPYVHWVRATDGCDPSFYLTPEDLPVHVAHLWHLARARLEGHRHATLAWNGHLRDWREKLMPGAEAPPMCHNDQHISVDLAGNRYTCHHNVQPVARTGNLFTGSGQETIGERKALALSRRWVDCQTCRICPIRTWCRGNCHLSRTHEIDCALAKEKHRVLAWLDAEECGPNTRNRVEVD